MRVVVVISLVLNLGTLLVQHSFTIAFRIPIPSTSQLFPRRQLSKRDAAIPTSPSGGYAPSRGPCPIDLTVRQPSVEVSVSV